MQLSLRFLIVGFIVLFCLLNESEGWRRRRRSPAPPPPCTCTWTWGACSQTCGGGVRKQVKTNTCNNCNLKEEACNTNPCPIDCAWSEWTQWSECSATCGDAEQSRTRSESTAAQFGGAECEGASFEDRECEVICCPVDCVLNDWTPWTFCSFTCGDGLRFRARPIATPASCEGECHGRYESEPCNEACCPTDCEWGEWSEWGSCKGYCGSATKARVRSISKEATCNGKECVGSTTEMQECDENCED